MAYLKRMVQATSWVAWVGGAPAPWHLATLDEAKALMEEGRFEDAERRARALVTARRGRGRQDRRPSTVWFAAFVAALAARLHGRQEPSLLTEFETLIAEAEKSYDLHHILLLPARLNRAHVLIDVERPVEAETEAQFVLSALARRGPRADDKKLETSALVCLGHALCAQGRYEEAEAIARGNLPRAEADLVRPLRVVLTRSLSGLGRHEEALAEASDAGREAPPHAVGHLELHRAAAFHALGRRDEARAEAGRALAGCERYLHPAHPRTAAIRTLLARITPS